MEQRCCHCEQEVEKTIPYSYTFPSGAMPGLNGPVHCMLSLCPDCVVLFYAFKDKEF